MNKFYAVKDELLPMRGTPYSAGYDFRLKNDIYIPAGDVVAFDSGVRVQLDDDKYLALHIRSSLGAKGIILANATGIIDSDYFITGETIKGMLWNTTGEDVYLYKGERYMQGVINTYHVVENDVVRDQKRVGGLGSTGK